MSIGSVFNSVVDRVKQAVSSSPTPATPVPPTTAAPIQFKDGFEPARNVDFEAQFRDIDRLKFQVADQLAASGNVDGARAMYTAIKNDPIRGQVKDDPWDKFKSQSVWDKNGTSTTFKNHVDFEETNASMADRKLKQLDQVETMSKLVGHKVDPNNVADVKQYFDKLSAQKPTVPTAEIQKQYGEYVQNFYQHPGGVNWGANPPVGDRVKPDSLTGMLANQPKDETGRTALDCEGHTYLTAAIFQNNPRFDVVMASSSSHISACVFEKNTDNGFSVDTMQKPIVNPVFIGNPEGLKGLGPIAKQHELLAKVHHGGGPLGQGIATTVSRDISKVNSANVD